MTTHIGVSPLTGRIYQGRVNKSGDAFVGDQKDITSDVFKAVIDTARYHGGTFEIHGGAEKWTVIVVKQGDKQ